MADLNRASLMGRLGRDPEIRTMSSGDRVASFSLATGERWTDKATGEKKERAEWHQIVVFGPLVNTVEKWLTKGKRVHLEGPIRTRKWQDQSGNDRYTTEIVLSGYSARLDLIDFDEAGGSGAGNGRGDAYGDLPPGPPAGSYAGLDDEIPF